MRATQLKPAPHFTVMGSSDSEPIQDSLLIAPSLKIKPNLSQSQSTYIEVNRHNTLGALEQGRRSMKNPNLQKCED